MLGERNLMLIKTETRRTSKLFRNLLKETKSRFFQNPDLSPIKNLWKVLKINVNCICSKCEV